MEERDRQKIQGNITLLSALEDWEGVGRVLIDKGIIDEEFVQRIRNLPLEDKSVDFFLRLRTRGPYAFEGLVDALVETGNLREADALLGRKDGRLRASSVSRRAESLESESPTPSDTEDVGGSRGSLCTPSSGGRYASQSRPTSAEASASPSPRTFRRRLHISEGERGEIRFDQDEEALITTSIKTALLYNQGKTEDAYPMCSNPRGFALIINNIEFPGDELAKRWGAENDSRNLQLLFEDLGFEVTVHHNVTRDDLLNPVSGHFKTFLDQFSSNCGADACVVAIMSHGESGERIRTADPGHVYISLHEDVVECFSNLKAKSLIGKPKLFIVQACRGGYRDKGVRRRVNNTEADGRRVDELCSEEVLLHTSYTTPTPPGDGDLDNYPSVDHVLICMSTLAGYVANRDVKLGTWYIRLLVDVFRRHAHDTEIRAMLRKVSLKMRSVVDEDGHKQMCCYIDNGLYHDLYFNPGIFVTEDSN